MRDDVWVCPGVLVGRERLTCPVLCPHGDGHCSRQPIVRGLPLSSRHEDKGPHSHPNHPTEHTLPYVASLIGRFAALRLTARTWPPRGSHPNGFIHTSSNMT